MYSFVWVIVLSVHIFMQNTMTEVINILEDICNGDVVDPANE